MFPISSAVFLLIRRAGRFAHTIIFIIVIASSGTRSAAARETLNSSEWPTKTIRSGNGAIIVSHNGRFSLMRLSDVINDVNIGKSICVEGLVKDVLATGQTAKLSLEGAGFTIHVSDASMLQGIQPGHDVWLAGQSAKDAGGGIVFNVARIERIVPADRRFTTAYEKYRKAKDWVAIRLLAERIREQADIDIVHKKRYLDMWRNDMAKSIYLKTLDPTATDPKNPDALVARAREFMTYALDKEFPRMLIRKALKINPDHPDAVALQPILLPDLTLIQKEDGTHQWIQKKDDVEPNAGDTDNTPGTPKPPVADPKKDRPENTPPTGGTNTASQPKHPETKGSDQ